MANDTSHNPFEKHINSESFDVSRLGTVQECSEMDNEIDAFFDNLPDRLSHNLWDSELNERQQLICAHITTELAIRVMREEHGDILDELNDDELIYMLTTPVTIAMLAEERLHYKQAIQLEQKKTIPTKDYQENFVELSQGWGEILNEWFSKAKDFVIRLFRRN